MGSSLAAPHGNPWLAPLVLLEIPHPVLCEWERKLNVLEEVSSAGPAGGLPPPVQEGPPQLPFWGPIPPFSYLPSELRRRLWPLPTGLWNHWVTVYIGVIKGHLASGPPSLRLLPGTPHPMPDSYPDLSSTRRGTTVGGDRNLSLGNHLEGGPALSSSEYPM